MLHDDTLALQNAIKAAAASTRAYQPFPGSQYLYSAEAIELPPGVFVLDGALQMPSSIITIQGQSGSIIRQSNAAADVLHGEQGNGYHVSIDNVTFEGGRSALWLGSQDVDGSMVTVSKSTFQSSLGFAIYTVGLEGPFDQRPNDIHLSEQVDISDTLAYDCRAFLLSTADENALDNDWVEANPSNNEMGAGLLTLFGAEMQVNGGVYIPGPLPYGTHWIDDYGEAVYSKGVRWSPETLGGIPVLFDYENQYSSAAGGLGARSYSAGTAWDTVVSITDGELTGGASPGAAGTPLGLIDCITGCPASLTLTGNYYMAYNNVILAAPFGLDLNQFFSTSPLDGISRLLTNDVVHYTIEANQDLSSINTQSNPSVPAAVEPYTAFPQSYGKPRAGNWTVGQTVKDLTTGGTWVVSVAGKAAPAWGARQTEYKGAIVAGDNAVYIAEAAGETSQNAPEWSACVTDGCTITDGDVIWSYYAPAAEFVAVPYSSPGTTPQGK